MKNLPYLQTTLIVNSKKKWTTIREFMMKLLPEVFRVPQ